MSIGKNIKKARIKAGLTQKELAKRCRVATGTIQQYELEKREPRSDILSRIAQVLDISPYDLFDLDNISFSETKELLSDSLKTIAKLWNGNIDSIQRLEDLKFDKLINPFLQLNDQGQDKAIEQVELLTKIPEYQKDSKDTE